MNIYKAHCNHDSSLGLLHYLLVQPVISVTVLFLTVGFYRLTMNLNDIADIQKIKKKYFV